MSSNNPSLRSPHPGYHYGSGQTWYGSPSSSYHQTYPGSHYKPKKKSHKENVALIESATLEDYESEMEREGAFRLSVEEHASIIRLNRANNQSRKDNQKKTARYCESQRMQTEMDAIRLFKEKTESSEKLLAEQYANSAGQIENSSSRMADNDAAMAKAANTNNAALGDMVSAIVSKPVRRSVSEQAIVKPAAKPSPLVEEALGKRDLSTPESFQPSKRQKVKDIDELENDIDELENDKCAPTPEKKTAAKTQPPPPPKKKTAAATPPPPPKEGSEIDTKSSKKILPHVQIRNLKQEVKEGKESYQHLQGIFLREVDDKERLERKLKAKDNSIERLETQLVESEESKATLKSENRRQQAMINYLENEVRRQRRVYAKEFGSRCHE